MKTNLHYITNLYGINGSVCLVNLGTFWLALATGKYPSAILETESTTLLKYHLSLSYLEASGTMYRWSVSLKEQMEICQAWLRIQVAPAILWSPKKCALFIKTLHCLHILRLNIFAIFIIGIFCLIIRVIVTCSMFPSSLPGINGSFPWETPDL